jgi:hypothetical protein
MSIYGAVAVILVVTGISALPSRKTQALLYSLPIPMTIVFIDTGEPVSGDQLLGVLLLLVFFYTVAALDRVPHLHRIVSVVVAALVYIVSGVALNRLWEAPFDVAIGIAAAVWITHLATWSVLMRTRPHLRHDPPVSSPRRIAYRFAGATASTSASTLVGDHLGGFICTFPYSGIPVALTVEGPMLSFAREFGFRSVAMLGFVVGYHAVADHSLVVRLSAGWMVFLVTTVAASLIVRWVIPGRRPTR